MPQMFKVKYGDGVYEVPEHELDEAISLGGEPLDDNLIKNSVDTGMANSANSEANLMPSNNNNNMAAPIDGTPTPPLPIEQPAEIRNERQGAASPKIFMVEFPDNHPNKGTYKVPEHDLKEAISLGGKVLEEQELTYGDRALQYARGAATIPAIGADLVNNYVAAPALNAVGGVAELASKGASYVSQDAADALQQGADAAYKARDFYKESNLTGNVAEGFNELAGKDITPKDTTGKILNAAGEFSFPLSNVAKGAKGLKEVGGAVAKHLGVAAAGGATLEGTKDYRITEEGTMGRVVEDFLQTVMGMSLADKGLSAAKRKIVDSTEKTLGKLAQNVEGEALKLDPSQDANALQKGIAKVLSLSANPNIEANAAARAEGIELPFEVALNGKPQKFLANTGLKSLFVTKAYNNVIENADRDMINAVRSKIDQINPTQLDGELSSIKALDHLKSEDALIGKEVNKLYEHSSSLLKETDAVKPESMYKAMNDILAKMSTVAPSKDMLFVANRISRIGKVWGLLPDLSKFEDSPELIAKLKESLSIVTSKLGNLAATTSKDRQIKKIPAKEFELQIKALKNDLNYERDIPGIKNMLNGFISSMEKDLGNIANKEYLEARSAANKYFKENEVDRIRTNIAQSLMKGEVPKQAFTYMSSAPDIRQLNKIMGESEAANEIMTSLKRAKLEDVLVKNIMDASGTISYANFSNLFNKAPEKQALLKELLGEHYAGIKKLSQVSQQFVTAGKDFGNPSRTTLSARDTKGITDLVKVLGNTGLTLAGSTALHGGIGFGLAVEPMAINILSRIASDKKIVNTAIKYAESSKLSKGDQAILENRLTRMVSKFLQSQWEEIKNYPQASLVLSQQARDGFAEDKQKEMKDGKAKSST
jgi:hypothetical protein